MSAHSCCLSFENNGKILQERGLFFLSHLPLQVANFTGLPLKIKSLSYIFSHFSVQSYIVSSNGNRYIPVSSSPSQHAALQSFPQSAFMGVTFSKSLYKCLYRFFAFIVNSPNRMCQFFTSIPYTK